MWCLNCKFICKYHIYIELLHTSKHIHQVSTFNHVFVHCTYFATLLVVCRIEVEPEPEGTPFVEDPEPEPRQQGKQPPPLLIMSIKTHFPLFLLCMNRMLPCIDSYRIVEPNPLHDLSFVHSSKQTSILADIGCL